MIHSDRVSQLEFELDNAHQQMMEQETEALDAIAKWQQNSVESEERCAELEKKLKNTLCARESTEVTNNLPETEYLQLKEVNNSLQKKIKELEVSLDEKSDHHVDSETRDKDTVSELEEALKAAQKTLIRDEEVVQQWEGKSKARKQIHIITRKYEPSTHQYIIVVSHDRTSCGTRNNCRGFTERASGTRGRSE